jgi:hypothetical protein
VTGTAAADRRRDAGDHVRERSPDDAKEAIDRETLERVRACARQGDSAIAARLAELDGEWDIERWLETNGSILAGAGLALGVGVNRKWLLLSGAVVSFCLQHAVQGWCPPVEVFRRLGVRTQREIERERYALKALRGDFASAQTDAETAFRAAAA